MAGYGFHRDISNNRLDVEVAGTTVLQMTSTGLTIAAGGIRFGSGAQVLGLGVQGSDVDIASGVLTVTRPYTVVAAESGTSDTVTSIVLAGQTAGDLLVLQSNATDTITYDDASIELGGTTRVCAPGGKMFLVFDGSNWSEISFVATADNA